MIGDKRPTTILAADVVGYSKLMNRDETGTLARLTDCEVEVIDPIVRHFGGHVFKRMGDGFLVSFSSAGNAIECALLWQSEAVERDLLFRIGIHSGVVIARGTDLFGDGVNIAARLESIAEPGGIVVSENCRRQIAEGLPLEFEDLGAKSLKNIADPVRIFAVRSDAKTPNVKRLRTLFQERTRPKIAVLPLVTPDAYFDLTLAGAGAPPFTATFGALDASGAAAASLDVPAGTSPSLAGATVHHAALTFSATIRA